MVLGGSEKGTRIVDLFQRSPIRIMSPRADSGSIEEAVLVNIGAVLRVATGSSPR